MVSILEKMKKNLRHDESPSALAAVAIILYPRGEDFLILFVKRAIKASDPWSGDMAFPGGKKHVSDERLMDTVFRETMEETGIDLRGSHFLGMLNEMDSNVRKGMLVQPFIFLSESLPEVVLNDELCAYFWIPISELEKSRCRANIRGLEVPGFKIGGDVVWGLTYRMVENLITIINEVRGNLAC